MMEKVLINERFFSDLTHTSTNKIDQIESLRSAIKELGLSVAKVRDRNPAFTSVRIVCNIRDIFAEGLSPKGNWLVLADDDLDDVLSLIDTDTLLEDVSAILNKNISHVDIEFP